MGTINELENRLDGLAAANEQLAAENRQLSARLDALAAPTPAAPPALTPPAGHSIDRRQAMRSLATVAFGGAALFGASSVANPARADAAESAVMMNTANYSSSMTTIDNSYGSGESALRLMCYSYAGQALPQTSLIAQSTAEGDEALPQIRLVHNRGRAPGAKGYAGSLLATAPSEGSGEQNELYFYHQGIGDPTTVVGRVHTSAFSNLTTAQAATRAMSTFRGGPFPAGTRDSKGRLDSGLGGTYVLDLSSDVDPDCVAVMATVTTYDADTAYYLWMWGAGARPSSAVLRYEKATAQTLVIVELAPDKSIQLWTKSGRPVHVQVDIVAQIRTGQGAGGEFTAPS